MKIVFALIFLAVAAQATIVPREIIIPRHQLKPRLTGAEWTQILANQEFILEVVENFKLVTAPQDDGAGAVRGDVILDAKIFGGSTATRGQFPWQVSITMDSSSFCGGSIISKDFVLTAAHCIHNVSSFLLVFGSNTPNGGESGSVSQISRTLILHEEYDNIHTVNDIGLIRLNQQLTWTTYIGAVKLPARSDVGNTFEGSTARVSGWGKTADGSGGISTTLMFVDMPIISNDVCAQIYGPTVTATTICTSGAGGKNTCHGDSGGPLCIQGSDGLWTEVGIVSFGAFYGCRWGYPAGYTRVTSYLFWIENNTGIIIGD